MSTDTTAWGVVVPDLPGCFLAANEGIDQAIENAKVAIALLDRKAKSAGETRSGYIAQMTLMH